MSTFSFAKEFFTKPGYLARIMLHSWKDPEFPDRDLLSLHNSYTGYVRVPESHILHGKDYNGTIPASLCSLLTNGVLNGPAGKRGIIDLICFDEDSPRISILFDVHGSLTFSGTLRGVEGWWFGFDTGHAGDEGIEVQDLNYMTAECESLAKQLHDAGEGL